MPMLIFCSSNFESNGAVSCLGTYGLFASRMCRLLHPSRLGVLLGRADEVIEEPFGCGAECPLSGQRGIADLTAMSAFGGKADITLGNVR